MYSGYKESQKNCPFNRNVLTSGVIYVVKNIANKIRAKLANFAVFVSGVHCIYLTFCSKLILITIFLRPLNDEREKNIYSVLQI